MTGEEPWDQRALLLHGVASKPAHPALCGERGLFHFYFFPWNVSRVSLRREHGSLTVQDYKLLCSSRITVSANSRIPGKLVLQSWLLVAVCTNVGGLWSLPAAAQDLM